MAETRQIVVPGDVLDDSGRYRPGANTYKDGSAIYASRLGVKTVRGDQINVIGLSGRYDPQRGDMVIGTVVETGPSNWYISVGASGDVGMHVNDVPWRVEFGETVKYLNTGDTVLLKVFHVDELRKVQVTMKDRAARKLTGGIIIEVAPSKVPRIIGRNGSMIALVKNMTNTRMFVGQNGIIWLDGEAKDVALAISAIRMVEEQAHTTGLTDKVKAFLEANGGVWREEVVDGEGEGPTFTPGEGAPRHREFRERTEWSAPPREERPPRREGGGGGRGYGGDRRGGGGRDRRGGGGGGRGERGGFRERREGGYGERRGGGERREGPPRERREGGYGERREGPPRERREAGFGERREGGERAEGAERRDAPFAERREGGEGAERPPFRERREGGEGAERPAFRERREGGEGGERPPFRERREGGRGERGPYRGGDRPPRREQGEPDLRGSSGRFGEIESSDAPPEARRPSGRFGEGPPRDAPRRPESGRFGAEFGGGAPAPEGEGGEAGERRRRRRRGGRGRRRGGGGGQGGGAPGGEE